MKTKHIVMTLVAVFVGLVVLDQVVKNIAVEHLQGGRVVTVIDGLFDFSLAYNRGAAFGMGREWSEAMRKFVFLGLSCVAVLAMIWMLVQAVRERHALPMAGLTLIVSGAVGNLIDRFRLGYVVDYIHWFYKDYHWPNFNIADSCICVGIGFYAYFLIFQHKPKAVHEKTSATASHE